MLCAGKARIFPPGPYLPNRGPRIMASAMAQKPPTAWTTDDPAKSTYPCPRFRVDPICESQPPPHVQHPEIGYKIAPMKSSHSKNDQKVMRSQTAPTMM